MGEPIPSHFCVVELESHVVMLLAWPASAKTLQFVFYKLLLLGVFQYKNSEMIVAKLEPEERIRKEKE